METLIQTHTTQHTVSFSVNSNHQEPNNDMIEISIKYPKDWQKERFFKDGDIKMVGKDTAELFVKAGIATYTSEVPSKKAGKK